MTKRKSAHKTKRGTYHSAIPVDADMSKVEFNVVAEFDNEADALKCEDELILKYNTIVNGWNKQRSGLIEASDKKAYDREYKAAHKEEITVYNRYYMREYKATHREELAAYMRNYQRAYRARKKAMLRSNSPYLQ